MFQPSTWNLYLQHWPQMIGSSFKSYTLRMLNTFNTDNTVFKRADEQPLQDLALPDCRTRLRLSTCFMAMGNVLTDRIF